MIGYTQKNKEMLRKILLEQSNHCEDITRITYTKWGVKYEITRMIEGPNGNVGRLITSWEVKGTRKRLITAIVQPFTRRG